MSQVLMPLPLNQEDNTRLYDLAPGSGRSVSSCVGFVQIGEGVTLKDLSFTEQDRGRAISIIGQADTLVCQDYRFFAAASGPGKDYLVRFADCFNLAKDHLRRRIAQDENVHTDDCCS